MIEFTSSKEDIILTVFNFSEDKFSAIRNEIVEVSLVKSCLKKFCEMYKKKMNSSFGRFKAEKEDTAKANISDYTHKIVDLYVDNEGLKCKIKPLNTTKGRDLYELIANGYEFQAYLDPYDKRVNLTEKNNYYNIGSINLKKLFESFFGPCPDFPIELLEFERQYNREHNERYDWMGIPGNITTSDLPSIFGNANYILKANI